ncbi:hypothetical protein BV25DRAFT_1827643 [Artomyces pyxidatus]|uniref:Uncharacterized protein n=1 Tax=Artomyces pyxidatus TaxID=48021 RepID=A0ACB8SXT1_9AGAM|nr:hypothetical protein BV25DRAFT_1827643 [Artomyces pyxidatus]
MARALPTEVLKMILGGLSVDELRRVRAVNTTFCAIATPAAFRSVGATNTKESAQSLENVLSTKGIARYVQEVVYRDEGADGKDGMELNPWMPDRVTKFDIDHGDAVQKHLAKAFSLLAELPSLTALRLIFHPKFEQNLDSCDSFPYREGNSNDHLLLQLAVLGAIVGASDAIGSRLRSLSMLNFIPMHTTLYTTDAFHALFIHLTHLYVSTVSDQVRFSQDQRSWFQFWRHTIRENVLPYLKSVTSLKLYNDQRWYTNQVDFSNLTFPHLKYLALGYLYFNEDVDEEDVFVKRHAKLEWVDKKTGPDEVNWIRRSHVDEADTSALEVPPSTLMRWAGRPAPS